MSESPSVTERSTSRQAEAGGHGTAGEDYLGRATAPAGPRDETSAAPRAAVLSTPEAAASEPRRSWPKIIVGAVVVAIWLPDSIARGLPMHGDMSYPVNLTNFLARFVPMWTQYSQTSNLEAIDRFWATTPFLWGAHLLGISLSTMYKLYLLASLLLAAYAMYFLVRRVLREIGLGSSRLGEATAVIAGLLFAFSPWAAQQYQAPYFYLAYAGTPALVLLLYKYLKNGGKLLLVSSVLLLSIMASTPQYTIFTALACLVLLVMVAWQEWRVPAAEERQAALKKLFKRLGYFVGIALVANLYWIVPGFVLSNEGLITPGYKLNVDILRTLSANSSMFDVLIGRNLWINWYHPVLITGTVRTVLVAAAPVVAILMALFVTYRYRSRSLLLRWCYPAGLVAMFISAWPAVPEIRHSYYFAVLHMPLGWLLRVPEIATYLWWVAEPVLLAVGLTIAGRSAGTWVAARWPARWRRSSLTGLAPAVARSAAALAILAAFSITSGVNAVRILDYYYKPITLPTAYSRAFSEIAGLHMGQGQVLDLAPYYAGGGQNSLHDESSYTWNPSRITGYGVAASIPARTIAYYHMPTPLQKFASWAQTLAIGDPSAFLRLLQEADIKYVLFHNDIVGAASTGDAQLANLRKVTRQIGSYGGGVYLFQVPGTRRGFTLSALAPSMWSGSLVSALTRPAPATAYIVGAQILLPRMAKEELGAMAAGKAPPAHGSVPAGSACSPAVLGLSQVLGDPACASAVIAPAQVDTYATSTTHWNAMRTMAPMDSGYGGWDSAVIGAGLADNGFFDMGQGVVMASAASQGQVRMAVHFTLKRSGTYLAVVRALTSPVGGGISIGIDGSAARSVRTVATRTRFRWLVVGSFSGHRGDNTVHIENYTGTNALNIVALLTRSQAARIGLWPQAPAGLPVPEPLASQASPAAQGIPASAPSSMPVSIKAHSATSFSLGLPARSAPELLTTDMPCQAAWQVRIAGSGSASTPSFCVDGFWAGAIIPAGPATTANVVYGPQSVWATWMIASAAGFPLIAGAIFAAWVLDSRRRGATLAMLPRRSHLG